MSSVDDNFGFYAILTDPLRGYDYLTNILVEHEVSFVQLRMKNRDRFSVLKVAELMRKITEGSVTKLIINDDIQITEDCGADGVHLGQDDTPVLEARAALGESRIIGLSTHSIDQVKASLELPVDYIGVGPVWTTPTKDIPDPVLGLQTMREMVELSKVPAVCIGGIGLEKISEVLKGGGRNFSLVRPLCSTDDPKPALKKILEITAESNSLKGE